MFDRKTLTLWLAVSHPALPFFVGRDFDLQWDAAEHVRAVSAFQLMDQHAKPVAESAMNGHWNIANFFFTTCTGICSPLMKNLLKVERELSEAKISVSFFSHSVTPNVDDPERLSHYAERMGLPKRNWFLLTGDREPIIRLAREVYGADTKTPSSPSEKEFVHSENVYLIDSKRRIRGIYNGTSKNSLHQLVLDLKSQR